MRLRRYARDILLLLALVRLMRWLRAMAIERYGGSEA